MKLTLGQKFVAVIICMVAVAALIVFLLIVPQATKLRDLGESISQAESDVDAARSLLAQRQAIKARAAETDTQLLRLANQLPENPELPSFIIELQDVVNESGLDFTEVIPDEPVSNEQGFHEISIQLRMRGEWPDVVDVLQRLRRIVRQVRIVSIEVKPWADAAAPASVDTTPTEQKTQVEAVIKIEIYTLSQAAPTATPAPAQP